MIKLRMTVEHENGTTTDINVGPVSQIALERKRGESIVKVMGEQRIEDLMWLAWHAETKGAGDFDAWIGTVTDLSFEAGGAVDPTPTIQRTGS